MSGNWFLSKQEKSYRWKKIVLKWGTSHTLVGCSRAGWTSPRSSQRSFSSGSPLRISALGNLRPTKNKWRQNQVGKRQNCKPNSAYWTWRFFAVSCDTWELFASEPLHSRRGVCALRGLLGNRNKHVITLTSPQHHRARLGLPFPHWPVALGASSGAGSAGLPLCFQQHLFHVALLGGRGDLLLAPVMTCASRGTEMELNPRLWKSSQGLAPIC